MLAGCSKCRTAPIFRVSVNGYTPKEAQKVPVDYGARVRNQRGSPGTLIRIDTLVLNLHFELLNLNFVLVLDARLSKMPGFVVFHIQNLKANNFCSLALTLKLDLNFGARAFDASW